MCHLRHRIRSSGAPQPPNAPVPDKIRAPGRAPGRISLPFPSTRGYSVACSSAVSVHYHTPLLASNMKNIRNRLAETPEFLTSVARELEHSDHTRLLLVSKHFFRTVGPVAWESVPRLDILLKLIKGTKVHFYKFEDSQRAHYEFTEVTITLSKRLSLTRFKIYAPWVQHLEIFGGAFSQELENSDTLSRLEKRGPILPNLRRLTAYTGAQIKSFELLWFMGFFICPTLTEIRAILHEEGHPSYIKPDEVPTFLKLIRYTCPQVQNLEFYPSERTVMVITQGDHDYKNPGAARYNIPGDEYRTTLASFSNLRSFSSTMYILQPETFSIFGQMPLLESLGIHGSIGDPPVLDESMTIPETWFPKLTELILIEVHPRDVTTLWEQPPISQKLVSFVVHCDPSSPTDPSEDPPLDGNDWIEQFLISLPRLSPHVKNFQFIVEDDNWSTFKLSQKGYDALHELKLEGFVLNNIDTDLPLELLIEEKASG